MPSLHSPVVVTSVPSRSIVARSKNSFGCRAQTFSRASSTASHEARGCLPSSKRRQKSPAVVGSGIRSRAQGVEEDFVVAAQFDVFQPRAVAQGVVGQVQHVIRLVIGQMDFQQVHAAVDGLDQPDLLRQPMHHADATHADAPHLVRQLNTDVRRGEHRLSLSLRLPPVVARFAAWLGSNVSVYCVFTRNPPCIVGWVYVPAH